MPNNKSLRLRLPSVMLAVLLQACANNSPALLATGCRAAADPGPVIGGPPATYGLDLLADVFSRADDLGGSLAAETDRRGVAGAAYEQAFDALMTHDPFDQ